MTLILLFNTVWLDVGDRTRCESIQIEFVRILERYLKFVYGPTKGPRLLGDGMLLISEAMEYSEISRQRIRFEN